MTKLPESISFSEPDQRQVYVYTAGPKDRKPKSYIGRYGQRGTSNSPAATSLRDPYDPSLKDRFEDTYRSDGQVKRGIDKSTEMLLGKHGRTVLDSTEEFPTFEERKAALEEISQNEQYQKAKTKIDQLQRKKAIKFHDKLISAVKQCFIYGRSAIEVVRGPSDDDWPTALHVLNSKRLGKVEVNPDSWEFLGVHYADLPTNNDLLDANDLIYFTVNDDHVTPRSLHYGLSLLEPVIDASETKRIIKQEDLKEAAKALYAGVALIRFMDDATTAAEMQNFANQITPGGWTTHKHDIEVSLHKIADNLQQMVEICDFINREELRDIGIPSFIGGYEQIANYANSQQVLLAYKEAEIMTRRTWLQDILESQWLNKLFYQELGIDPDADPPPTVKLNYEFEDITFETTLDKANTILPLYDRHLVTGDKVLRFLDMDDVVEEFKNMKEERDLNSERQFQLKLEALKTRNVPEPQEQQQEKGPMPPNNKEGPSTSVQAAKARLFDKLALKIDQL